MRAIALFMMFTVAGCAKSAPPPGKNVEIESACNEKDQTRVRVSGYLRYERSLLSFCSNYGGHKTCDLMLYASAEKPGDWSPLKRPTGATGPEPVQIKLSVPVGSAPGEMAELPDKFTEKDIVVHLPNKGAAGEGAKVTIDGTLSVVDTPGQKKTCWVNVEWAAP